MELKSNCSRQFSLINSWATCGPLNTILLSTFILVEIIVKCIKSSCYLVLDLGGASWPRGGMVTRRIANPIHSYTHLQLFPYLSTYLLLLSTAITLLGHYNSGKSGFIALVIVCNIK